MSIKVGRQDVTLKCNACKAKVTARFTFVGKKPQVTAALKALTKEAERRGWDTSNDLCPEHK